MITMVHNIKRYRKEGISVKSVMRPILILQLLAIREAYSTNFE